MISIWDKCRKECEELTDDELRIEVVKYTTPGKAKKMTRKQMIDKIVFWVGKGSGFSKKNN